MRVKYGKNDLDPPEIYKGVKVYTYNAVVISFSKKAYKELIDVADDTGLSIRQVLAYSGQPCERCKGIEVIVFTQEGESKKIKRGLMTHPHQTSGRNILNHAKGNRSGKKDTEKS